MAYLIFTKAHNAHKQQQVILRLLFSLHLSHCTSRQKKLSPLLRGKMEHQRHLV